MPKSILTIIEESFINDLALLVKEGWEIDSDYRQGWFDGFATAWTTMTARSRFDLVSTVNAMVEGCGNKLELR